MVAVVLASFQEGAMYTGRDDGRQAALLQAARRARAQGSEPKKEAQRILGQELVRGEGREVGLKGAGGVKVDGAPNRARVRAGEEEVVQSLRHLDKGEPVAKLAPAVFVATPQAEVVCIMQDSEETVAHSGGNVWPMEDVGEAASDVVDVASSTSSKVVDEGPPIGGRGRGDVVRREKGPGHRIGLRYAQEIEVGELHPVEVHGGLGHIRDREVHGELAEVRVDRGGGSQASHEEADVS